MCWHKPLTLWLLPPSSGLFHLYLTELVLVSQVCTFTQVNFSPRNIVLFPYSLPFPFSLADFLPFTSPPGSLSWFPPSPLKKFSHPTLSCVSWVSSPDPGGTVFWVCASCLFLFPSFPCPPYSAGSGTVMAVELSCSLSEPSLRHSPWHLAGTCIIYLTFHCRQ